VAVRVVGELGLKLKDTASYGRPRATWWRLRSRSLASWLTSLN